MGLDLSDCTSRSSSRVGKRKEMVMPPFPIEEINIGK